MPRGRPERCCGGRLIDLRRTPVARSASLFDGGAILPKGGAMGFGLAVMAEMLCDAMLGPATTEVNWLIIAIDATRHRDRSAMQAAAEGILAELRDCPPAPGSIVSRCRGSGSATRGWRIARHAAGKDLAGDRRSGADAGHRHGRSSLTNQE